MVTVKKVAELANVSPSTVSRVINGAENVNPEIRERVKKVISETGYFPNNAARSLVNRKTGAIAVLIRNLHKPFFYDLLRGMKDAATAMHKCVLFCNLSDEKEERNKYMQFLTNGIVDSMILYGTLYTDWPIIENLSSSRFPFILIENNFDNSQFNQILINNFDGAMNAVRFLAKNGHERIVLFRAPQRLPEGDDGVRLHADSGQHRKYLRRQLAGIRCGAGHDEAASGEAPHCHIHHQRQDRGPGDKGHTQPRFPRP